ncbi:MAG: chemotaxis protein CheW [Desulfobulbaceae bacterium]|nr:chemotaxis protein CheW [Desulfobulbaceae bacterium]HIJ78040.1 hypothetical protein [Deltaproteobacteria bacterium]
MQPLAPIKSNSAFSLDQNTYCNDSLSIKKVLGVIPSSALPISSKTVMGSIYFHGKIVPVLDLRINNFSGSRQDTDQICILSAESGSQNVPLIFGALVDSVADAYALLSCNTH